MPRHEPSRRQTAGEPPPSKVKMRLDEHGRWVPTASDEEAPEPAEGPPAPDEPRPAAPDAS